MSKQQKGDPDLVLHFVFNKTKKKYFSTSDKKLRDSPTHSYTLAGAKAVISNIKRWAVGDDYEIHTYELGDPYEVT